MLLLAFALAAPVAALAQDPPGAPPPHGSPLPGSGPSEPPTARAITAALCIAEFRQLGEAAFRAKYLTKEACMQEHADQAAQILASCKSAADPKACIRGAIAAPDGKPGNRQGKRLRHRRSTELEPKLAAALCRAELKTLGADAFKQKYGTAQTCMKQMAAKVTAVVQAARAQCASAEDKRACVHAAIAKALGLPTGRRRRSSGLDFHSLHRQGATFSHPRSSS
jgi:hypothetical protein